MFMPILYLCNFGWSPFLTFSSLSGVKNADEAELRQVASEPLELNVYNVNDFPLLSKLVSRLVRILCGKMEDRSKAKSTFVSHTSKTLLL